MGAHDARRVIRIAGHLDAHGTLVHDDDQHDLARVGDRREALQDFDAVELFGGAKAPGHFLYGVRLERRADLDAGHPQHVRVTRGDVALDADLGEHFVRLQADVTVRGFRRRARVLRNADALHGESQQERRQHG